MKKIKLLLLATILMAGYSLTAQVAINTDGSNANSSAMLDVKSISKGFLPPRMREIDRDSISSPVAGLVIWCNNCGITGELQVYNGTVWVNMIGDIATGFCDPIADIDGHIYNTVVIGSQCWMAENLTTIKYNDGTGIPLVTDDSTWVSISTPAYSWYNNDSATYGPVYGALYNWYAVNTGKLCPTGWHVPTDAEWSTLTTYLGGLSVAGGKLKETGTTHWDPPNTDATNETGFTALPGGKRSFNSGVFGYLRAYGYWWTSTPYSPNAWYRQMYKDTGKVIKNYFEKREGYSVRCLKN
ncbi:MAG: fibrobacter succinogenes major paralogous domain-containing protein [Bacteroidales bacterium]|nr:fibrobacter succinogenes major paralogous domain-containing protein [Bacteroidales bacterium]